MARVNMFGNLEFGEVKGYHLSHLGIALKNAAGQIVSYDKSKNEIVDVDLIDFDANGMIWAMPVALKDVKVGDVIRHTNGNAVFVVSTEGGIHVVDVAAGEKKEILPTKSMFGFNYVTKIVSLVDFSAMSASEDQPFGNMLPFMLMNNSGNMKNMLLPIMLMNGGNLGSMDMNNPLMLMALMGGSESKDFFLPLMLMTQSQQKLLTNTPLQEK